MRLILKCHVVKINRERERERDAAHKARNHTTISAPSNKKANRRNVPTVLLQRNTTWFINVPKTSIRHVPRTYANDLSRFAVARFIIRSRTLSNYHK